MREITCIKENKVYPSTNFFKANEESIFGNNTYIPFCKKCIANITKSFFSAYGDVKVSLLLTCMKLDIGFDNKLYEALDKDDISPDRLILLYLEKYTSFESQDRCFDDTGYKTGIYEVIKEYITNEKRIDMSDIQPSWVSYVVSQEDIDFWDTGYTQSDYAYLSSTLANYLESFSSDTASSLELIKQICYTSLELKNTRHAYAELIKSDKPTSNLQKNIDSLTTRLSNLLSDANMKPNQKKTTETSYDTLGMLVKKIEDEEPIADPLYEWTENDIFKSVSSWVVGQVARMLEQPTDSVPEFEEELDKYSVVPEGDSIE